MHVNERLTTPVRQTTTIMVGLFVHMLVSITMRDVIEAYGFEYK